MGFAVDQRFFVRVGSFDSVEDDEVGSERVAGVGRPGERRLVDLVDEKLVRECATTRARCKTGFVRRETTVWCWRKPNADYEESVEVLLVENVSATGVVVVWLAHAAVG